MNKHKKNKINKILTINLSAIFSVLLFLTYVYQVNVTTVNASGADLMKNEISSKQSEISKLEFNYIQKTRSIGIESASEFSLVKDAGNKEKVFVKRDINKFSVNER